MNAEDLMRTVTAAFAQSDLAPVMNALHEDVVWKTASRQPGPFSFHGDYRKRAGVVEVMSKVARDYTFHHMTPKQIVTGGDAVWGLFDVALSYDPKGKAHVSKPIQLDMAIHWRLKDGKIIEHQTFFDTAAMAASQTRRGSP